MKAKEEEKPFTGFKTGQTEQSLYSKRHLYNLDEDDDEIDFLYKGMDLEERADVRIAVNRTNAKLMKKQYDRLYFVEKFPEISQKQGRDQNEQETVLKMP